MIRNKGCILLFLLFTVKIVTAQTWKIGADIGRAYFHYQFKDYGQGYSNAPRANHGFTGQVAVKKNITGGKFLETGLRFVLYEQYYTTRLYNGTWEQRNPVIFIPALIGFQSPKSKIFFSVSGGVLLGIMPDQYEAKYAAFYHPDQFTTDSITRGIMKRNYTPVFPLLNLNLGVGYRINANWETELRISGAKGFIKITEFDIYYNDGSGENDQRAKQWGKGDFAAISIGLKYRLKK